MDRSARIVFVTGAGSVRALGGLMLNDLLVHRPLDVLKGQFPDDTYGALMAVNMYHARNFFLGGKQRGLWNHAEQFIDIVETAHLADRAGTVRDPALAMLKALVDGKMTYSAPGDRGPPQPVPGMSLEELATRARQCLAADCSLFLRTSFPTTEAWQPYRHWAGGLLGNHTIITFNYDLVPERLIDALAKENGAEEGDADGRRPTKRRGLEIIEPSPDAQKVRQRVAMARDREHAPVLKLHGSTNWTRNGRDVSIHPDMEYAVICPDNNQVVIGVPGPGKALLCGEVLAPLWTEAEEALRAAHWIFFVGYRFPQSDAESRARLLDAIRTNENPDVLQVRTVLSPESLDTTRLKHLLSMVALPTAANPKKVNTLPLYAEDFLSLIWSSDF